MLILFKVLLILAVIVLCYILLFVSEHFLAQRILGIVFGVVLCTVIVFPDLSTRAAHVFGVGRGVDFLFYISHLTCLYFLVILYRRVQVLQKQLTRLVREKALENPQIGTPRTS